jgi:hypothetical protein
MKNRFYIFLMENFEAVSDFIAFQAVTKLGV